HLLGAMLRGTEGAMALLRESVELSARLGIKENEVMARHTLTWALTVQGQSSPKEIRPRLLEEGFALSRVNRDEADRSGDDYLVAWCARTAAAIEWLRLTDYRTDVSEEARLMAGRLVDALRMARKTALSLGDLETATLAANDAVAIWRDVDAIDFAITEAG